MVFPLSEREQLVPVGEAGEDVDVLVPCCLQGLGGLDGSVVAGDLLRVHRGVVKAHGQVVDVLAAEDHLLHLGAAETVKVDVPQPAGLAGEVFAADSVHQDNDSAGLFCGADIVQVGVVGHGILVLAGEEGAVVGSQGEADHAAVFQNVVVDDRGHGGLVHPCQGADRPGGQDIVDVVDAAETEMDLCVAADGQPSLLQVQICDGEVRIMAAIAAAFAVVVADMVVVVAGVDHAAPAHRAPGPVVVDTPGRVGADGAALQAEPLHLLGIVALGEPGHQGIVGVEDQGGLRVDGGQDGGKHPLRVAVAGQLIPVEVGDDKVGGVEVAEAEAGVALIALQQQYVSLHFSA